MSYYHHLIKGGAATPSIITSGLILNLDAANSSSYSGSGTTWTDLSGVGNNGTLVNGVGYSSANGGSLVFDGVNDYVSVNAFTTPTSYSVSVWAKVDYTNSTTFGRIIEKGLNNEFTLTLNKASNQKYNFQLGDSSAFITSTSLINLTPKYDNITITVDNIATNQYTVKMYINGINEVTSTKTVTLNTNNILYIGGNLQFPTLTSMFGNIPDVMMYNRVLTSIEVITNFDALKSRYGY
jgi:hypothetical protein